jgi:hypothetical protein
MPKKANDMPDNKDLDELATAIRAISRSPADAQKLFLRKRAGKSAGDATSKSTKSPHGD